MSYKIVIDSCCELPDFLQGDSRFEAIPLGLEVGDYHILDDENFDQATFLKKVADCPTCPKSSCPSPERFMEAYHCEAERVYVITLSSHLSGSYNSAVVGIDMYSEKYGEKNIHVIDSESASCGETQIALKLIELEEQGLPFQKIVEKIEEFRSSIMTLFVLDNLETLRKNGRMSGVKALVASTLNIKPIMAGEKGIIVQKGQSIGINKALNKMAQGIVSAVKNSGERNLIISHCNCPERAEYVKKIILEKLTFKACHILDMRGISSMYANDGGIIVTV